MIYELWTIKGQITLLRDPTEAQRKIFGQTGHEFVEDFVFQSEQQALQFLRDYTRNEPRPGPWDGCWWALS